jgi:hypothetical protein
MIVRGNNNFLLQQIISRLSPEEKKVFENKLKGLNDTDARASCNISPYSDKILTAIKYGLIVGLIALIGTFSSTMTPYLKIFEHYLMITIAVLIGFYFIRALYEGKRCGVCQFGNTAAVMLTKSMYLGGRYLLNYWILF